MSLHQATGELFGGVSLSFPEEPELPQLGQFFESFLLLPERVLKLVALELHEVNLGGKQHSLLPIRGLGSWHRDP